MECHFSVFGVNRYFSLQRATNNVLYILLALRTNTTRTGNKLSSSLILVGHLFATEEKKDNFVSKRVELAYFYYVFKKFMKFMTIRKKLLISLML